MAGVCQASWAAWATCAHSLPLVISSRGVTSTTTSAEEETDSSVSSMPAAARAFVPGPVRPLPPPLAKTQVEGTHFPHGDELPPPPAAITAAVRRDPGAAVGIELTEESVSSSALVVVEVTPLEEMTSGKLCAQVAHAAQLAWQSPAMPEAVRSAWAAQDYRVRVSFPTPETWEAASRPVSVVDAGFTELDGPRETTRARW